MSSRVVDLAKKYIVYNFYEIEDDDFFTKYKVKVSPTVLVFKSRKVVKRFEGIVDSKKIVNGVQTRKQQKTKPWYKLW